MIVADNALISYLIIPGDFTDQADRVRSIDSDWIAPPLWLSEFRSVLRKYILSGRLSVERAFSYVDVAEMMMQGRAHSVSSHDVLKLVSESRCTAYDCEYVALANSTGVPLITPDKQVLRAFPETAVHPTDFSA